MHIISNQPAETATAASVGVLDHDRVAAIACPRERAAQVARLLKAAVNIVTTLRELRRSTVQELRQQQTAVSEVAALVGVSPQRVSQLTTCEHGRQAVAA